MAYDAGTAFLAVVPSFRDAVTAIAAEATKWGEVAGDAFKGSFESQVQDLNIGVQPALNQTDVGAILSELDVVTADRTVQINPTIGAAASAGYLASLAALIGFTAAAGTGGKPPGGAGMGIVGMLLFGGGGIAGIGAGFGSILGLMGFGMEHLVTTAIGLIGSAAGALAGGGLLALGGLGVLGVGMGVDMGVSLGAMADLKAATTDYQALTAAVQQYGAGSYQAAQAQATLNMAMASVPAVARAATLATAISLTQLGAAFSKATGPAENLFMQIAQGAIKVATNYIPLVGAAATRNFTLIKAGLQPLFAYLSGPATTIFQELENLFATSLPYAMNAFDQGAQLVLKTMALVAPQTGGLIKWISEFLTKMNTPAGFAKWSVDVGKLIYMFHTWWDLLKQVAITVFDLFSNSKGLGTGIVSTITSMLKSLDQWLTSTSGKKGIGTLFSVHKSEFIDLLKVLGPIVAAIGKFYIALSPLLIGALVAVLVPLTKFINLLAKNPVTAFIGGMVGLVLLSSALRGGIAALAGVFGGWGAVMDALLGPIGLVILALVGIGVILVESYIHFKAFRDVVNTVVGNIGSAFVHLYDWVSSEVQGLQRWLKTHWAQITDDASIAWNIVSTFVKIAWEVITSIIHVALLAIIPILQVAWSVIFEATKLGWEVISTAIGTAITVIIWTIERIGDVVGFFQKLPGRIKGAIGDAWNILLQVGKDIVGGLLSGIQNAWHAVTSWIGNAISGLTSVAKKVLGISSPSTVFTQIGLSIGDGLAAGLLASTNKVNAASRGMLSGLGADLGLTTNSAIMASVGVSGGINLGGMSNSSVLGALQRIESAIHAEGAAPTGAAVSTKMSTQLVNVFQQQARTTLQVARST